VSRFTSFLSVHLLTALVVSFVGGISLTAVIQVPVVLTALSAACALSTSTLLYRLRRQDAALLLLPLAFISLGALHSTVASTPSFAPAGNISQLIDEKREAVIIGTLTSMATYNGETGQALLSLQSLRFADSPRFIRADGPLLVSSRAPWPEHMQPGSLLALRLTLQRPSGFNTPGVFNYRRHLARQGIMVTGFVTSPAHIHPIYQEESLLQRVGFLPELWRHRIGIAIDRSVAPPLNGIYRALVIGDQYQVEETTRSLFRDSGVMHILSVSGSHFAIISGLLFGISSWLLRRSEWLILRTNTRKLALLACLPPLVLYSLLAGMNTPVLRTLVMCCTAVIALCIDRRKSSSTLLATAAFLILLINPHTLFTASFQLSFAAVAAIALSVRIRPAGGNSFNPEDRQWRDRARRWLATATIASLAATLGTAPLLLHHFNSVSLIAPLSNLIIEPLICLYSLPLALLACLALPFSPDLADMLLKFGTPGLHLAMWFMKLFSNVPLSNLWLASPPIWLTLLYYSTLLLMVRYRKSGWKYVVPSFAAFSVVLSLFVLTPYELAARLKKDMTVTFIDVGQGNATLLEFPGGVRVLVDGGGSSRSSRTVGASVLAPFLWHKGISRVHHLIVTHPDADHYNGLPFILDHFSPDSLWVSHLAADQQFTRFIEQARTGGLRVSIPVEDEHLEPVGGGLRCVCNLAASQGKAIPGKDNRNEHGLIVRAVFGGFSVLFPGDIGKGSERLLIRDNREMASTVLLAAHHGSRTSNSGVFFNTVAPGFLVVSAGKSPAATFPHPGLLRQCETAGIRMLTTARDGTIEMATDGKTLAVETFRDTGVLNQPTEQRGLLRTQLPVKGDALLRAEFPPVTPQ
jgi:competence protein ComEC